MFMNTAEFEFLIWTFLKQFYCTVDQTVLLHYLIVIRNGKTISYDYDYSMMSGVFECQSWILL